jgi:hypothetical protein
MEECLRTMRGRSTIKWNMFLKPVVSCVESQFAFRPMGIQRRTFAKDMDALPTINSMEPTLDTIPAMNLISTMGVLPAIPSTI